MRTAATMTATMNVPKAVLSIMYYYTVRTASQAPRYNNWLYTVLVLDCTVGRRCKEERRRSAKLESPSEEHEHVHTHSSIDDFVPRHGHE